jgi:hypothetical protein
MSRTRSATTEIPHSWDLEGWPSTVFPGTTSRARYIVRTHKDELIREGALARVGRELVVFGARYTRWLEKRASEVPGYVAAPNRRTDRAPHQDEM